MLVGLLAALIATLTPVESPVPLGPLEGLTGSAPAEAQTAITSGTPDPCPAPWQPAHPDGRLVVDPDKASLCVRSQPACSEHPLQPGSYLAESTEFPDFCEAEVLLSVDAAAYMACTALTGYVIKTFARGVDLVCRMIRPTQCAPNMHRTEPNLCRQVQRRTWSCTTGTPTNRFNTCYQQPPDYGTLHPACGVGAPNFAISSCEDYVSQDFERAPAPGQCVGFDTGGAPRLWDASNTYWCEFDASYLDVDCYGASPACTPSNAVCIKRASTTGGCYAIANALRCRDLQADYHDGSVDAEDVYLEGCVPCVVLPFSPTPPDCPPDLLVDPTLSTEVRLEDTHQRRRDSGPGGSTRSFCTDPPRGRLVWESSHHSEFAIVNSPVVLRVVDVPVTARRLEFISVNTGYPPLYEVSFLPWIGEHSRQYFEYPNSAPSDPVVRTWPTFDDTLAFTDVDKIVGATRLLPGRPYIYNTGPCLIRKSPDFRVRVTELWPDNDTADIEALFGSDALNWWRALSPTLQRERTEARGLDYISSTMTTTELAAELAERASDLTQEVRCNYGTEVWCNWRPTRPGYYRLVAAGAWYLDKFSRNRRWLSSTVMNRINNALMDMYNARDGVCTRTPGDRSYADYDCLRADLASIGLSPAEAGLEPPNFDALTPVTQTAEWLYSAAAGPNFRCPPRDMRVACTGGAESSNYTETQTIGILVHEVRVSTVAPDR